MIRRCTQVAHAGASGRRSTEAVKIRHTSVRGGGTPEKKIERKIVAREAAEGGREGGSIDDGQRVKNGENECVGKRHAWRKGQTTANKHRYRFQWGKIEGDLKRARQVGTRAELKAGKTRNGYITACKCG